MEDKIYLNETESPAFDEEQKVPEKQKLNYLDFKEARKTVRKLGISSESQWKKFCKGEVKKLPAKPFNIPSNPEVHYHFSGWKSWEDWLGK